MPSSNGTLYLLPWFPSRLWWDRVDKIHTAFVQLIQGVLQNKDKCGFRSCHVIGILTPWLNSPLYYPDEQHSGGTQDSYNFFHFVYTGMERERHFCFQRNKNAWGSVYQLCHIFSYTHTVDISYLALLCDTTPCHLSTYKNSFCYSKDVKEFFSCYTWGNEGWKNWRPQSDLLL